MVLIEGEREALEFLGNLLLAQARYEKDCSFFIGPKSVGKVFFSRQSTFGFYIHRLPCLERRGLRMAVEPREIRSRSLRKK